MPWLLDVVSPPRLGSRFRLFLGAFWFSNLGDGLLLAAGPLLVASRTSDPLLVALATIVQRLPWVLFGLWAGAIADRFDRRRVALSTDAARVAVLGGLGIAIAIDRAPIGLVLVALFAIATAETLSDTAIDALMPSLVDDADLGVANARVVFGHMGLNNLAGPPLGAVLFAAGMASPFLAHMALLAAAVVLLARLELPPLQRDGDPTRAWEDIRDGLLWLWRNPPMRALTLTLASLNVTFGASVAVQVLYAKDHLGLSDAGFGVFLAAVAVGGLLGSSVYARLEARFPLSHLIRAVILAETAAHLGLALAPNGWVATMVMFGFGFEVSVWATTARTVRQRAVPEAMQGRIFAAYRMLGQSGMVLGSVIGGAAASLAGLTAPYWFAFAGSVLIAAAIWPKIHAVAHASAT